ncbi:MAG: hypothetical protein QOJ54_3025, partial [Aliidongia sp.]|nr:hypothetical protein [Aliidongia sp.]
MAYAAARMPGSDEPDFDKVIADCWLRVVWGRISAPTEIDAVVQSDYADTMPALVSLITTRHDRTYR